MREKRVRRNEAHLPWRAGWVGVLSAWLVVAPPGLPLAFANPEGEQVVVGEANFLRDAAGQRLDIHTATDLTVVDFEQASVGAGEALNVFQPTDEVSQFWARDGSGRATHIDGSVWSNAQVGYLNPYGIFLGGEAQLDVSTFVAGAGEISNEDLLAGRLHFRELTGEVGVAAGAEILARDSVSLLGRRVANYGHIRAPGGMVAFVAGGEVLLSRIEGHLRVRAEAPPADSDAWGIEQAGHVEAPGGYVSLTAGDHYSLALNHSGITRARDIEVSGGSGGRVEVAGTLDASDATAGAHGGNVKVLGERIALQGARIDASGDAGGGEIRVGGDVRGATTLPAARRTYVSSDSELRADALSEGEGGSVVVWAEERTGFFGEISARGGTRGGDGGFAEVSARSLTAPGRVDLGADAGASGTLLYDPTDIVIEGGTPEPPLDPDLPASGEILYGTAGDVFRISQGALETTNANILLEAANSITVSGSFDVSAGESQPSVDLLEGNSLSLRTRNDAGDQPEGGRAPGIDLMNGDGNTVTLTFRTKDGNISLQTGTGSGSSEVEAAIRVWGLEADGGTVSLVANNAGESVDPSNPGDPGVHAERLAARGGGEDSVNGGLLGVNVSVADGDIAVGEIDTDGFDARSGEGEETLSAEVGANVIVLASEGVVTLRSLSASGGDSAQMRPGDGGAGAFVSIRAEGGGGDVFVADTDGFEIDASGGKGWLEVETSGTGENAVRELVGGRGGRGGFVKISGSGRVRVGAVAARGGASESSLDAGTAIDGTSLIRAGDIASAGTGGIIEIDGGAAASEESEPGAGDATAGVPVLLVGDLSVVGGRGDGELTVEPIGQAGTTFGVAGGTGGILRVAGNGEVHLGEAGAGNGIVLDASGGSSGKGAGGAARRGAERAIVIGREATGAEAEPAVGDIIAYASLRANGGQGVDGGAGGDVLLRSPQASVTHHDIDSAAPDETPGIAVNGGVSDGGMGATTSGTEQLLFDDMGGNAGTFVAEAGTDLTVGSVSAVGGLSTSGRGGGEDGFFLGNILNPEFVSILLRSGIGEQGSGNLTANGVLDVSGGDGHGEYQPSELEPDLAPPVGGGNAGRILIQANSGSVTLEAGARGVAGVGVAPANPCTDCLPGSAGFAGRLQIETNGAVIARSLEEGFERISVEQRNEQASTELFALVDGAQVPLLGVTGAAAPQEGQSQQQTVMVLSSPEDFGSLAYRLDVPAPDAAEGAEEPPPVVGIEFARGLGELQSSGGLRHEIINENGGVTGEPVELDEDPPHLQLSGALRIEATDVVGLEVAGVDVSGMPSGTLALAVGGETDGLVGGEVGLSVAEPLASLEIEQSEATAAISVTDANGQAILTANGPSTPDDAFTLSQASSQEGMSLLLGHTPTNASSIPFVVAASAARVVGGDLLLRSSGALTLGQNAIVMEAMTPGQDEVPGNVALSAAGDIASADELPAEALVTGAHTLLLETRGAGNANVKVEDVQALAAKVVGDLVVDFAFSGEGEGDLEISHEDVGEVAPLRLDLSGIEAGGAVTLRADNPAQSQIRLGDSGEAAPIQVRSGGDQFYDADGLEIANVREDPEVAGAFLNDAKLVSTGDGIEFTGRVDTAADALDVGDLVVPATLTIETERATTFGGDVGGDEDGAGALARLQSGDVELGGDSERSFIAGELAFLGSIDGSAVASFYATADAVPGQGGTLVFGGNIGTVTELAGLKAKADLIEFTSAERVVVGAGGIDLNVDWRRTEVPDVATITDTQGNIAFETSGDFKVGHFQTQPSGALGDVEKFSTLGALRIQAGSVEVGDLSADSISITAPEIRALRRSGGQVLQPDGSLLPEPDQGVDWVANDIATSSAILPDTQAGYPDLNPVKLVIGSGGVSVPESFVGVEVVRFGDNLAAVKTSSFQGPDEQILDLTGDGPQLIGVPTQEIPRPEPAVNQFVQPSFGDEAPAAAPAANALEVLALLDCAAGECLEAEFVISHPDRGPLATPRAAEIARQYREHVASAAARMHLRASFQVAGEAFREIYPGAALSGEDFYRFLARSDLFAGTRADLDTLAELFAQVDLLGLPPVDAAIVQERLALDFAAAAALPGFDVPVVVAAVEASPVGLLR